MSTSTLGIFVIMNLAGIVFSIAMLRAGVRPRWVFRLALAGLVISLLMMIVPAILQRISV